MIGLSCLSLLGQKGSPGKWRKQPTVYREHVWPICHPLKVDLFQCYYVHYASCGSVQQYNDQVYILSLWVGGVTGWGAGLRGSSSLKLLWKGVFWFLHLRGRPTCFFVVFFSRAIKDSGLRFVVCFWKSLGLVYHHGCSLTSARHCCELLVFWMDVIESQLIGRCDGISARIGQWRGENKKYKKTPSKQCLTNRTAVGPKCYFAGFLERFISFHRNLSVFSLNNLSR